MIVDTSALVAIAIGEPEAELFYDLIRAALAPKLCAVSFVELVEVFARRMDEPDPLAAAQRIVETLGVSIIALSAEQAVLASQARKYLRQWTPCCWAELRGRLRLRSGQVLGRTPAVQGK